MPGRSADERTIERIVSEEILRDAAHRRGPKRDINKITRILVMILTNDKLNRPALTIKDINPLNMKRNDLEDHLAFLSKFPKHRPFLTAKRRDPQTGKSGAPLMEYRFNPMTILEWGQESKPQPLYASIILEDVLPSSQPTSENSNKYDDWHMFAVWHYFTYLDTINSHNTIKPEGQDSITVNLIKDFQHPQFRGRGA